MLVNSLNVNGFTSQNAKLKEKLCKYGDPDIICITETHLSSDEFSIEGYKWYGNCRKFKKKNGVKTFGGVGILVKDSVFDEYNVAVCANDYDGLLAVSVTHRATQYISVVACTYLAPSDSPYGSDPGSYFNRLLLLVYENCSVDNIIFCGDVNARIGGLEDITLECDVKNRVSVDVRVNSHGKAFLEFLNDSCCCVLNGRVGDTAVNTFMSTRGSSVIDYVYAPYDVVQEVTSFKILSCQEIVTEMGI